MRTELTEKIIGWVKGVFKLDPESTEAEIHEAIVNSNEDLKTELIANVGGQIAGFAIAEIEKAVTAFSEQLKADTQSTIEQLNAKLTLIENKLAEVGQPQASIQMADVEKIASDLREEFGSQLLEVKGSFGASAEGDGAIIQKATNKKAEAPKISAWKMTL